MRARIYEYQQLKLVTCFAVRIASAGPTHPARYARVHGDKPDTENRLGATQP
jgi:hypothetical protein